MSGERQDEPTMMVLPFLVRGRESGDNRKANQKYEHGSTHALEVHLARRRIDGNLVDLDTQICCTLVK